MKEVMVYYIVFAKYIWHNISKYFNKNILGRIIEGISIGLYANNIGNLIDNGISIDLIYKFIIAIILTIGGAFFQTPFNKKGK